ncbi:MAG: stalk domain-containing protein, partial [Butyricicoccus porcorum]
TMTKNSNIYYSNSAKVVQDSALVEQDGTVLIPVQALNEVLNASVNWSTSDKSLNGIVIAK